MEKYQGIGISAGIALGPVFRYECVNLNIEPSYTNNVSNEIARLQTALNQAEHELNDILTAANQSCNASDAAIFEAHLMMLCDPDLLERVTDGINKDKYTAEYAWFTGTNFYANLIGGMKDEYLAARSVDIKDVAQRVLRILAGKSDASAKILAKPSIVVANELTPSDTVAFDKTKVLAFCTISGGPTSHVAILSKALGIPAIVGIGTFIDELTADTFTIVDGSTGEILIDPDPETITIYKDNSRKFKETFQSALADTLKPACTKDGHTIEVVANIGSLDESLSAVEYGAEGVGLLRTEFIFLDRDTAPTEEEQFNIYQGILNVFDQRPVVIRTLDIGGDKPANYLKIPPEMNPFLGLRGTRLANVRPEVFQTQLRALFRAGYGHNLKVMFPMVGSVDDLRAAMEHVKQARLDLEERCVNFNRHVEIGIMVEIPSAAILADVLAQETDFFSIGTNDLSQYTLAADRGNQYVATLADAFDPAVLRLINMVVQAAHENKKWVGLCGELAGDPLAVPALLGLGVDEFSMNPRAIPFVKQSIRNFSIEEAKKIANHALQLSSAQDVRKYLETIKR